MNSTLKNILITGAVHGELEGIIDGLSHPFRSETGKRPLVSGERKDIRVSILTTGPGIVNTAQAITSAIERTSPDMIIQTGCAGLFKTSGGNLGDIGIAQVEIDVHSGIESSPESPFIPDPLPFALIDGPSGTLMNRYPIDPILSDRAFHLLKNRLPVSGPRVIRGPFTTVSTITASDERADALFSTFFPIMETMEGSAAAHVAILYGIPFLEIRSASNWVGKRDRYAWDLPLAFRNSSTAVNILIENIKELM